MITFKKIFNALTIKIEIYMYCIVVPLGAYFVTIAGNYNLDKFLYLLIGAGAASLITFLAILLLRTIHIKDFIAKLKNENSDKKELKIKILNYPKIEAYYALARWSIGLFMTYIITNLLANLTLEESMPYVFFAIIALPIGYCIAFFSTENVLQDILSDPKLMNVKLKKNSYKVLKTSNQILLLIITITLIPAIIFGYLLYASVKLKLQLNNVYLHLTFVILLSIITIAVILYESTRSIKTSIGTIEKALKNLEIGNIMKNRIPVLNRNEFGLICNYIDTLNNAIKDKVKIIKETSSNLIDGINQIKTSSNSLSTGSSQQAASVEEITSSMEEMSANIALNSENAYRTKNIAQKNATESDEAKSSIEKTLKAMELISNKINLIEGLTEKTDLLSLNASIEAARAGEQGKGFSVVASEVRKLADKSRNISKEITELSQSSLVISQTTGSFFFKIIESVKETADLMVDISIGSAELKEAIDQINSVMIQLNEIAQQNAALSEELSSVTDLLFENTEQMEKTINFFKV